MIEIVNGLQFKVLTPEQINALKEIKPTPMFVDEDTVIEIQKILELDPTSLEYDAMPSTELTAIRNSVVRNLTDGLNSRTDEGYDMMTRVSMITAVIDHLNYTKRALEKRRTVN